jgi:hypothetical protein
LVSLKENGFERDMMIPRDVGSEVLPSVTCVTLCDNFARDRDVEFIFRGYYLFFAVWQAGLGSNLDQYDETKRG